jgi:hypothetical protein
MKPAKATPIEIFDLHPCCSVAHQPGSKSTMKEMSMKTNRLSSTALAAAVAIIVAAPSAAWAGEGRDDGESHGWNRGGPKINVHNNVHYNNHYAGRYAAKGPYYYPPRYAYYPCSNCGQPHHHNNHNHDNDKLWIGLLGGGILGYGLGVYQQRNAADQDNYPEVTSTPPAPPVTSQYPATAQINPCLQEREYRTRIMVGGKEVEGYGTACLQPDGSWRYGTAQPAAY